MTPPPAPRPEPDSDRWTRIRTEAAARLAALADDDRYTSALDRVAWLAGLDSPRLIDAVRAAKVAGYTWGQISDAAGTGGDAAAGKRASSRFHYRDDRGV